MSGHPDRDQAQTRRQAAMAAAAEVAPEPTGLVEYNSAGKVLLIGPPVALLAALPQLDPALSAHCLFTSKPATPPEGVTYQVADVAGITLSGHMGDYAVGIGAADPAASSSGFDLVVDLGTPPRLQMPLKPIGYFAPQDAAALRQTLAELPGLVGRFEKPQFFGYDPDICAHGASGIAGCRRCLDACPAVAITSLGETVEVDPYLCQGGGICATVCPSGAMTYRYPRPADTLTRIWRMLQTFRQGGGSGAVLLLHGAATELPPLDERTLPLALEELASAGLEIWLSALAYGAQQVLLLRDDDLPEPVAAALEAQRAIANAILQGIGHPAAVHWSDQVPGGDGIVVPAAGYAGQNDKRQNLFLAIDHLATHAPVPTAETTLPDGAPLGRVQVAEACTLCMACTSVCPTKALSAGGDRPALRFFEANCVQCGLCAKACPERVIELQPRVLYDAERRRQPVTLREEEPFCCISCGKPFATRSVIEKMQQKLAGHWMYQDDAARRRLSMCDDCRVVDMMRSAS